MAFLEIVFRKERDSWYNKIDTIKYQLVCKNQEQIFILYNMSRRMEEWGIVYNL